MAHAGKFHRPIRFMQSYNVESNNQIGPHVPMQLVSLGHFSHACMEQAICQVQIERVPYFNAFIYAANRQFIGKVDDIFGKLREFSVSIRLNDPKMVKTFKHSDAFFIEQQKLLPMMRFLPKPKMAVRNMSAKTKLKRHAKKKYKNTYRSVGGARGKNGRGGAANINSRGGGRRNPQYKRMYSNNIK